MEGGIGATVIAASSKEVGNAHAKYLSRLHTSNSSDRSLRQAYSQISRIAEKLGLTKTIQNTASHMYKLAFDQKAAQGRGLPAVAAAVLFCACQQEGIPRTFKEFEAAVPEATKKDIGKAVDAIMACLQQQERAGAHAPRRAAVSDHMRRFCSHLGMSQHEMRACTEVADNAMPRYGTTREIAPWHSKSPNSIAAAILYMVTQLPAATTNKPDTHMIAVECGVTENALQTTYKDLYTGHASLIPSWFVQPGDLGYLQQPHERA